MLNFVKITVVKQALPINSKMQLYLKTLEFNRVLFSLPRSLSIPGFSSAVLSVSACGFGATWLLRCQVQQGSLGCSIQKQSPPGNSIHLFFVVLVCVADIAEHGRNLKSGGKITCWVLELFTPLQAAVIVLSTHPPDWTAASLFEWLVFLLSVLTIHSIIFVNIYNTLHFLYLKKSAFFLKTVTYQAVGL